MINAGGILYAIRLKANANLDREIDHLMTRPVGRPSKKPKVIFHSFSYQAASWKRPRRVIAKVEWHEGEFLPKVGFIVTNMTSSPEAVVHFYNKRGDCERWIKEGKHALAWTRLSCSRFASNRVRLALFVLAYNLGNFMRRFALPKEVSHWSLSSIQLKGYNPDEVSNLYSNAVNGSATFSIHELRLDDSGDWPSA